MKRTNVMDDCWNKIGVRGDHSCPKLQEYAHCRNCPVQRATAAALLAHVAPPDYVDTWTEHVSRPVQVAEHNTESAVIFRIGREWLALSTAAIHEVATLGPVHRVPHRTNGSVLGVVNVRGALLICVSLVRLLGLESGTLSSLSSAAATPLDSRPDHTTRARLLVIGGRDHRAACPVDEVYGVHRYAPAALTGMPATLAKAGTRLSRALLAWREQTVGVLDEELLFAVLKRGVA